MSPPGERREFSVIVMGTPVEFQVKLESQLRVPSEEALRKTHQADLDLNNWVLKNSGGQDLPFGQTEEQAGVRPGDELFLSPNKKSGG